MIRYAIVGCRTCTSPRHVFPVLDKILKKGDIIISGGAKGVDTLADKYAQKNQHTMIIHCAMWDLHGKAAGPIRNKKIVDDCDEMIVFWDGKSKGTRNSIKLAKESKKPIHIYWI